MQDVDWDTQDGRYRVRIYGQWIVVPDAAVVTEPNRFGPAVVWPYNDRYGNTQIRCFMPGAGTQSSSIGGKRLAVYNLCPLWPCILGTAMDERVEALLADVLALEGEDPNVIREGVRGALADYEQLFRAQEVNKRMKDKAAHACHALSRARLVEEIRLRKGTSTAEYSKVVLSIIDGPRFP